RKRLLTARLVAWHPPPFPLLPLPSPFLLHATERSSFPAEPVPHAPLCPVSADGPSCRLHLGARQEFRHRTLHRTLSRRYVASHSIGPAQLSQFQRVFHACAEARPAP